MLKDVKIMSIDKFNGVFVYIHFYFMIAHFIIMLNYFNLIL